MIPNDHKIADRFPSLLDCYATYDGAFVASGTQIGSSGLYASGGLNRHPLFQGTVDGLPGRAAFEYQIVSNVAGATTATVQCLVRMPILLSPFAFNPVLDELPGLTYLQSVQVICSSLNWARFWSHDNVWNGSGVANITAVSGSFYNPVTLITCEYSKPDWLHIDPV